MGRQKLVEEINLVKEDIINELYQRLMPDTKSLVQELAERMSGELKETFGVKEDATVEQALIRILDAQLRIKEGQTRLANLTDRMCRKLDAHLKLAEKIYALNDVWVSQKDAQKLTHKTYKQLIIAEKNGLLKRYLAVNNNSRGYSYAELMNYNKLYNKNYELALNYEVAGKFAAEREAIEKTRRQVYEDFGIELPEDLPEETEP